MLVFHHTVTAINELREPLHDEVQSTVFRVEGDRLVPVEESFALDVLRAAPLPIKSAPRRDEWVRLVRGKWFRHRGELEGHLREREKSLFGLLQGRADAVRERESEAERESYKYRLRELQDRSREQEQKGNSQGASGCYAIQGNSLLCLFPAIRAPVRLALRFDLLRSLRPGRARPR